MNNAKYEWIAIIYKNLELAQGMRTLKVPGADVPDVLFLEREAGVFALAVVGQVRGELLEALVHAVDATLERQVLAGEEDVRDVVRGELDGLERLREVCGREPQAVPPRVEPLLELPKGLSELQELPVPALPHVHRPDAPGQRERLHEVYRLWLLRLLAVFFWLIRFLLLLLLLLLFSELLCLSLRESWH